MKKLKFYIEYIKELYSDSISNRISELLNKMVNMFAETFQGQNNVLGENEIETLNFIDVERSNYDDAYEKNILMDFEDNNYRYQIFFIIRLNDIKNNEPIKKAYLIIKIYDNDAENTIPNEFKYNINIELPDEDQMLKEGRFYVKVKEINEKSQESQNEEGYIFIEEFIIDKIGKLSEL